MRSRIDGSKARPFAHATATRFVAHSSGWAVTEPAHVRPPTIASSPVSMMIGSSPAIAELLRQIEKIASADASVLIQGETGSGKELAARSIHGFSVRHEGPFVAINCGAVPDTLIETELFGHARGAFTDAREARSGVIAQAQSGTLFLDETDALSPKAQVTLLRFLQDLRYRPVGSGTEIASDVRIISASNQNLQFLVDDGGFRRDLFYRLNIFELWIPPLRQRPDDIELLALHFIESFSQKYGLTRKELHPETVEWLRRQDWPGNVRELENWIHRELLLADANVIHAHSGSIERAAPAAALDHPDDLRSAKARALADFESSYVARVLSAARGNVTAAARLAGKERRAFGRLLKKYGIDKSRYQD